MSKRPPALTLVAAFLLLLLLGWAAGVAVRTATQANDLDVVRDLGSVRSPSLTAAARALSLLGSGYVVVPLTLACSLLLLGTHRSSAALTVALGTFGAVAIANVDKLLVGRPRPPIQHLENVTSASFPSGHAAQSTGFFIALLAVLFHSAAPRRARATAAAAATLLIFGVAFSRVYLAVHYPSDVAAGVLLGASWAWLAEGLIRPHARQ